MPSYTTESPERLAERFYRGREVRSEGSGLGLAIVRRVAELHGGCLELENLAGGFEARLRIPPAGARRATGPAPG